MLEKKFRFFQIMFILLFLFFIFSLDIVSSKKDFFQSDQKPSSCGDGTFFSECSKIKPYFCESGKLVEKASLCGCSSFMNISNDSCFSEYQSFPKKISLKYILNGQENYLDFTVYGQMADYVYKIPREISYSGNDTPSLFDFKNKSISESNQRAVLLPLVLQIQNLTNNEDDQLRIAVSIVQNIPYASTNKSVFFAGGETDYFLYPYEVLYYNQGICSEKSNLLAFLLKEMGYGVAFIHYNTENHEAVGVKCPLLKSLAGSGYCFIETSGPAIIGDSSIVYSNGVKLKSKPQIVVVSEGKSIDSRFRDYKDARTLKSIRDDGFFVFNKAGKFAELKKRYGLIEEYGVV